MILRLRQACCATQLIPAARLRAAEEAVQQFGGGGGGGSKGKGKGKKRKREPTISVAEAKVSGWGVYCYDFLLLPITPYYS